MKCGPCKHDSVHERDRDAGSYAGRELTEHAAGGRTVEIEPVRFCGIANAAIERGYDEGLAVHAEAHMREKSSIKHCSDGCRVISAALRKPAHGCAVRQRAEP